MAGEIAVAESAVALAARARPFVAALQAKLRTSSISTLSAFKQFVQNHPTTANLAATVGITGIYEAASNGNKDALDVLEEGARTAGVNVSPLSAMSTNQTQAFAGESASASAKILGNWASDLDDDSSVKVSQDQDAVGQELALKELCKWTRGEISSNPARVKEYHQNMRLFLAMDSAGVDRMLKVFME